MYFKLCCALVVVIGDGNGMYALGKVRILFASLNNNTRQAFSLHFCNDGHFNVSSMSVILSQVVLRHVEQSRQLNAKSSQVCE